jgi:hypothetical protein
MYSDMFTSTMAALTMAAALALSAPAFAASDSTSPAAQAPQTSAQNTNATPPLTKQHVDGGDLLPDTKFTTQYERQPVPAYK